jgi:hypothetical protein
VKVLVTLWLVVFFIAARMWLEDHRWLRARKRSREPGLNTVADADAFVEVLRTDRGPEDGEIAVEGARLRRSGRGPGVTPLEHNDTAVCVPRLRTTPLVGLKAPVAMVRTAEPVFVGMGTPIHDQLVADIKARRRALRWPTAEMRGLFDALVEKWMCTFCEYEGCRGCPGCSCSCKLAVVA